MTDILEAIIWFATGAAAGLAISIRFHRVIEDSYVKILNDLLAANRRLRSRIDELSKKRERDQGEEWKDG